MQWSYGFLVTAGQDRDQRYIDAVTNNLSITQDATPEAEAARDQAFAYIDGNGVVIPYQIICEGNLPDQTNDTYYRRVSVRAIPTEG